MTNTRLKKPLVDALLKNEVTREVLRARPNCNKERPTKGPGGLTSAAYAVQSTTCTKTARVTPDSKQIRTEGGTSVPATIRVKRLRHSASTSRRISIWDAFSQECCRSKAAK